MTNEQLAAIETALLRMKALGDAATPGPWADPYYEDCPGDEGWWIHNGEVGMKEGAVLVTFALNPKGEQDARLTAAARTFCPALVDCALGMLARYRGMTAYLRDPNIGNDERPGVRGEQVALRRELAHLADALGVAG